MTTRSFRDIELLSAFLDGQLSSTRSIRLRARLAADGELTAVLADLRMARTVLRRLPRRRAPRSFILRPGSAAIRPPLPRAVPAFSWASAVAMFLFLVTFGSSFLKGLPFGADAPVMVAAPAGMGGGGAADGVEMSESVPPEDFTAPTLAPSASKEPSVELETSARTLGAEEVPASPPARLFPWAFLWFALAILFIFSAFIIRWFSGQAFKRRLNK